MNDLLFELSRHIEHSVELEDSTIEETSNENDFMNELEGEWLSDLLNEISGDRSRKLKVKLAEKIIGFGKEKNNDRIIKYGETFLNALNEFDIDLIELMMKDLLQKI